MIVSDTNLGKFKVTNSQIKGIKNPNYDHLIQGKTQEMPNSLVEMKTFSTFSDK